MNDPTKKTAPDGYLTISEAIELAEVARSTFYECMKGVGDDRKITPVVLSFKGKEKKFVLRAQVEEVFGKTSGGQSGSNESEHVRTPYPGQSENVRPSDAEQSELVRLRTENAVLLARLEAAQEAERVAQLDKEKLFASLNDSLKTVQFLEMRSLETARILEHHQAAQDAGQDEKKPGWLTRFFGR